MRKILLLSDTHGYIDDAIIKHVNLVDEVWHAGDIGSLEVTDRIKTYKPLKAVYGNIDDTKIRTEFPLNNRFMCEDVDVWITHIGGYPPKYNNSTINTLKNNPPNLFICGHSHILKVISDKNLHLLHMNPGAVGKHGFHKKRTMLRFKIDGKHIKDLEIIEFDRR